MIKAGIDLCESYSATSLESSFLLEPPFSCFTELIKEPNFRSLFAYMCTLKLEEVSMHQCV